jgi:tetratricopeptide (TPR) repeat protein
MELLPHIAIYFDVTVDELIGAEKIRDQKKTDEYVHNIRSMLDGGKIDAALELARRAVREYPINQDIQFAFMLALMGAEFKENDGKYKDEIIAVGERAINLCSFQSGLWYKARLIEMYVKWGMREDAKKLLETMPADIGDTQEIWAGYVLEGKEWQKNQEWRIRKFTVLLTEFIREYANKAVSDILEKVEWRKIVLQINSLMTKIYHGNEGDLIAASSDRAWDSLNIARLYCEAGDIENALDYAEKATQDAVYYCSNTAKKAFHGYDISTTEDNICRTMSEDSLMQAQFDIIRNEKRFIKCIELLKANSHP